MNRRTYLAAVCTTGFAGLAGCANRLHNAQRTVEGPCDDPGGTWPTAGGDPSRTGQADTAPPSPDADVVDLLAGVRDEGQQRLASSLPAIADGSAYVPVSGGVVAVDLNAPGDGPIWSHELDDDVDGVPAMSCGAVLAPGLNQLTALDPASGDRYWQADVGSHGATAVASKGGTVYVAGSNPVAVDARTGEIQWSAEGGDTLALGSGGLYTTQNINGTGGIFAHDLDGEERWHLSLGKIVGSASVHEGTVRVADNTGTVYAIDAMTGETYWSRSPEGVGKIHSGLAVHGNDVVVPAGGGAKSVVLDASTGEIRWTADTGIVTGRPVVGDDWVAFGRTNIGVTLYDRSTGEHRATWTREEHGLGTVDGLAAIEGGFVIRGGTTSGLSLIS